MNWTTLTDGDGAVLRYVRNSRDGVPQADLAETPDGREATDAVEAARRALPGWFVATHDAELARHLLAHGTIGRHARTMSAPTADAWAHDDLTVVPFTDDLVPAILPGWRAAYPPGHPDHEAGTDAEIIDRCWDRVTSWAGLGEVYEPASVVVMHEGVPRAGVIIHLRPEPEPFGGPWVSDVWRDPALTGTGIGSALIARAMRLLHADGYDRLGLNVSVGNPAQHAYERLGFDVVVESWAVRLSP